VLVWFHKNCSFSQKTIDNFCENEAKLGKRTFRPLSNHRNSHRHKVNTAEIKVLAGQEARKHDCGTLIEDVRQDYLTTLAVGCVD